MSEQKNSREPLGRENKLRRNSIITIYNTFAVKLTKFRKSSMRTNSSCNKEICQISSPNSCKYVQGPFLQKLLKVVVSEEVKFSRVMLFTSFAEYQIMKN